MKTVGKAIPRIDGPLKTTGVADYASDHHFPGMLFAVPVSATIAKGRIEKLDASLAEKMPGVHAVFHRGNMSKLYRLDPSAGFFEAYLDERRPPFEDDEIRYKGQFVALAVADTFEQAQAAARAVKVSYHAEKPNVEPKLEAEGTPAVVSTRGDATKAFNAATVKVDHVYTTPPETHGAIELHATVAVPEGDSITLYETTQGVVNHRNVLVQQLGVGQEKVRVISKFLGSGFGGKLFPWPYSPLAAAAARELKRPVKLVLSREQVFLTAGHRPKTEQRVRLSATPDGKLTSIQHDYVNMTSILDSYVEGCGEATDYLYSCPNVHVTSGLARRNIGNPTAMRGPGAVPGLYATETAMDELAIALKMDPLQLRILNEPKIDEGKKLPFSSRHLLECYEIGAKEFGWSKRNPEVGSMKQGELTLGWGMAVCGWIAERMPAEATVELRDDGTVRVACGTQDIGTGTYTMLAQIASERLGVPVDRIEVVLGDSSLPPGPLNGGSMATGSVVPAVFRAADGAIQKLYASAGATRNTPLSGKTPDQLEYTEGRVHLKGKDAKTGLLFGEILKNSGQKAAVGRGKDDGTFGAKTEVSRHSYGVHFVEVTWDPATARLRVPRITTVIDAGRIVNPKTARNQVEGSVVMGIGMGLFEGGEYDHNGSLATASLADYVVPVNADVPRVDVHFLDYPDTAVNELGLRGVGEIGLAGVAAALSNAVYHATGVRVRDLPISIEKLLSS